MEVSPKFLWFIQLLMLVVLYVLGDFCPMGGFFYITRRPETQAVSLQRQGFNCLVLLLVQSCLRCSLPSFLCLFDAMHITCGDVRK